MIKIFKTFAGIAFFFTMVLSFQGCIRCGEDEMEMNCNCTQNYDSTVTYVKNDKVNHNGTCWYAVAQGRGITPGPWMKNSNDIWKPCNGSKPNN